MRLGKNDQWKQVERTILFRLRIIPQPARFIAVGIPRSGSQPALQLLVFSFQKRNFGLIGIHGRAQSRRGRVARRHRLC